MSQLRVPAGNGSRGGQFALQRRGEPEVNLMGAVDQSDEVEEQLHGEQLTFYRRLDGGGKRLFSIISDPSNDPNNRSRSRQEIAEYFTDEYAPARGLQEYGQAEEIAHRLREHYDQDDWVNGERSLRNGSPSLYFTSGSEGVDGYIVSARVQVGKNYTSISDNHGTSELTSDPDAPGMRAALRYAEAIDTQMRRVRGVAQDAGLIPVSDDGSIRPSTRISLFPPDGHGYAPIYEGDSVEAPSRINDGNYRGEDSNGAAINARVIGGIIRVRKGPTTGSAPALLAEQLKRIRPATPA